MQLGLLQLHPQYSRVYLAAEINRRTHIYLRLAGAELTQFQVSANTQLL